jgi:glutathione synthase/RimK-type ligase-like ATP-grasp enzyme
MEKKKFLIVRSRNVSCAPLREIEVPRTTILRLGSTTLTSKITKDPNPIVINSIQGCLISEDKRTMKKVFSLSNIPTAEWITSNKLDEILEFKRQYKSVIAKKYNSSKGYGIYLFNNEEEIIEWSKTHNLEEYVFEKFYTYTREYRIHVTREGCFYACRKMLKNDAEVRWHRHADNCIWALKDSDLFDRPTNWDDIVASCMDALKAIGLDIAAFDVKVQSSNHKSPKYIILESNSAPALGEEGIQKYKNILIKMINEQGI